MDKVQGGTPTGNKSICATCRHAQNTTGLNLQVRTRCNANYNHPVYITYPVSVCSMYDDKRMPSFYNMEQIAWTIQTRSRGPAGFAGNMNEVVISPPNKNGQSPVAMPPQGKIQDDEREK